jgi:hypothetical protein
LPPAPQGIIIVLPRAFGAPSPSARCVYEADRLGLSSAYHGPESGTRCAIMIDFALGFGACERPLREGGIAVGQLLACLAIWAMAATAAEQPNLVDNGSFETDAERNGIPDRWQASGDGNVTQTLTLERGRDGSRCARLECTRFATRTPASHAMLCQMGVPIRRGKEYRVTFWARGERIAAEMVSVALSDTSVWDNCGLQGAFAPSPEWKQYEFLFQATRDCAEKSRLQIWFTSTGTLWVDDVQFTEVGRDFYRPGAVIAAKGFANLVPNASFECGADGWGSAEWDRTAHWGGSMNRLFGQVDPNEAFHGRSSLKIELSPENQPVCYFDYYELHRTPIRAPLAGNAGFIEVQPGRLYTLSAYLKAARAETPALLAVREFQGRSYEQSIRVSAEWHRYALTFTPTSRWCYVLAGPDLRRTAENRDPPDRATLWLDSVQLEPGPAPTPFQTRLPMEFGISTDKPGNVFGWDEAVGLRLQLFNSDPERSRQAVVHLALKDFFDQEVFRDDLAVEVPGGSAVSRELAVGSGQKCRGFLRLEASMDIDGGRAKRAIRLAVIPVHPSGDSRFGMNHAYPWPHLLDLSRKAGLVWVRDWSCKWQQVEPEKGRFTFAETDDQINRPLRHGLKVLGLLPFPSSHWSSTAPPNYRLSDDYVSRREHVAYAPRDSGEFENYVERTVSHYQDRVGWWQVFNEPIFTSYSLPRRFGYGGADYARWTKSFAQAARRADPHCQILAGIGYLSDGQILDDWEQFLAAGGLQAVDAVDIHHYPRLRPPEFIEDLLQKLNALMDEHGGRKPIWLTEYGYYADDEPSSLPIRHSDFNVPLESERLQAEYAVRWATIMLAGGVERIFYHAGTCGGLNGDSLEGIFYEYGGTPRKIYAAQAVMAHLFTPACRFVKRLSLGEGVKAYLLRDGSREVVVVWAPGGAAREPIRLVDAKIELWDLMGRAQPVRQFTPGGTPVYVVGEQISEDALEARR